MCRPGGRHIVRIVSVDSADYWIPGGSTLARGVCSGL